MDPQTWTGLKAAMVAPPMTIAETPQPNINARLLNRRIGRGRPLSSRCSGAALKSSVTKCLPAEQTSKSALHQYEQYEQHVVGCRQGEAPQLRISGQRYSTSRALDS